MKPSELFDLSGQVAVVIGGTGELCGAIAEALAAAGAHTVIVGRDAAKAEVRLKRIRENGGSAEFAESDVTDGEAIEALAQRVKEHHTRIDVLVNGAGVNSATPFFEIQEDEIDRILTVNLKGVVLACQSFGRIMVEQAEGGSIINLGSISGLNPLSRVFTYAASKAAVHNLTRNLAREWAPRGVRVNTLVPGFFPAEQNRKVLTPDRVRTILGKTPMARFGEAHELHGAALLLASRRAGGFITGTEMVVDGGFNAFTI